MALLEVEDLTVHFATEDGLVKAVDGVSYRVDRGQALGIVGESGSGKSVSSLTVMGLTRFVKRARSPASVTLRRPGAAARLRRGAAPASAATRSR